MSSNQGITDKEHHRGDPPATEEQVLPPSRTRRLIGLVGSFYMLMLAVAMGALWLFIWLAGEVLEQEFTGLNRELLLFVNSFASPTWERLAFTFTWIGSVYGIAIITTLFGIWLLSRRRFVDVATLLVTVLGGTLLTLVLKEAFQQIRPDVFPPLAVERNFSFPSGHSLTSLCLWGFIGGWLVMQGPKEIWRWLIAAMGLGVALLVGLSRLYLGVHWPTDVVAGFLVAAFWVSCCITGQRWLLARRMRRHRRRMVAHAPHTLQDKSS